MAFTRQIVARKRAKFLLDIDNINDTFEGRNVQEIVEEGEAGPH